MARPPIPSSRDCGCPSVQREALLPTGVASHSLGPLGPQDLPLGSFQCISQARWHLPVGVPGVHDISAVSGSLHPSSEPMGPETTQMCLEQGTDFKQMLASPPPHLVSKRTEGFSWRGLCRQPLPHPSQGADIPACNHQTPGLPVEGTEVQTPSTGALPCLTEGVPLALLSTQ